MTEKHADLANLILDSLRVPPEELYMAERIIDLQGSEVVESVEAGLGIHVDTSSVSCDYTLNLLVRLAVPFRKPELSAYLENRGIKIDDFEFDSGNFVYNSSHLIAYFLLPNQA